MKFKVPELDDSACGLSLRDGSLSVAFAFIVGMCIGLVGYVAYLKGRVQDYNLASDECFFIYLEITVLLILLVVDIILVVGVVSENPILLIVWLLAHSVYLIYITVRFVASFYTAVVVVEVLYAIGVLIFYAALIALVSYSLLVVWSYLSALRRRPRRADACGCSGACDEDDALDDETRHLHWASNYKKGCPRLHRDGAAK